MNWYYYWTAPQVGEAMRTGSIFATPSGIEPVHPSPPGPKLPEPDSANFVNVTLNGKTFINKGMVAFGLIPAAFRDETGETFGGVGSAIALKRGTWKQNKDGSFSGSLIVQPDRGFNVDGTINYQGRQHEVEFTLNPYYSSTPLSFNASQKTLALQYKSTLLYTERQHKTTTGLDSLAVRNSELVGLVLDPQEPIANKTFSHLNLDAEGLVLNSDGTSWVSDEYGPYVHLFSSEGDLIRSIQPPDAVLPFQDVPGARNPVLNFTASVDPTTGRAGNQGFEGLTINPSGTKLFVFLQSATIQDGGSNKDTQQNTRLFVYDISSISLIPPVYIGQYVVTLPVKASNNHTFAQSELHYLSDTQFLVLARDGNGNGDGVGNEESKYKNVDLFDISEATNIAHTQFDSPAHPIAVNGVVVKGIKPAKYQPFISMIDSIQLGRFGLHNGVPIDPTLLNSKWESLALAPVGDPSFPDDYFIITASDNDFLTTNGVAAGMHYDAGSNVDSQFMVWRATLPSVQRGSVETSIGIH
ncbi:hypothetical protein Clacol_003030 [Clathrus columnatus]|uniref:Phytase-like domain-containing protein n=1 Tax=Clathrus columnatus TaxID=1419009 RepID=A0AAV5A8C3_9AGAM|nr:hypothetical protein Clacol_003030 [Clathrus columnatus]